MSSTTKMLDIVCAIAIRAAVGIMFAYCLVLMIDAM